MDSLPHVGCITAEPSTTSLFVGDLGNRMS